MTILDLLHLIALAIVLSIAVFTDLRERRIANKVTIPGLLAGLVLGVFMEGGVPFSALGGAGLALIVSFPLVALGGLGAGDAKLLTAVGAFVGAGGLLPVLVYGALSGGVLAVGSLVRRGAILGVLLNAKNLVLYAVSFGRKGQRINLHALGSHTVPYGVAIAAGAVLAWFFPFALRGGA